MKNVEKECRRGFVNTGRLADRLGLTVHQSVLERRLKRLMHAFPSGLSSSAEDWLMDVAHARGARVVCRMEQDEDKFVSPSTDVFPNEELVVAICGICRVDQPQRLRLAAQLVSRGAVNVERLILLGRRERVDVVLGELARQALKVEPEHSVWRQIAVAFPPRCRLRSPIVHWQRLAWPVMETRRRVNAQRWELVR
jgi:hypothetical protein